MGGVSMGGVRVQRGEGDGGQSHDILVKDMSSHHGVHSTERIIEEVGLGPVVDCPG